MSLDVGLLLLYISNVVITDPFKGGRVAKVTEVPKAPEMFDRSPERLALENAVNTAVWQVTQLEVQLRGARVAERRARAALAELG